MVASLCREFKATAISDEIYEYINFSDRPHISIASLPGMADRTKIPNPYWNARAWARIYREKLDRVTKLAARHERIAESLEASVESFQ